MEDPKTNYTKLLFRLSLVIFSYSLFAFLVFPFLEASNFMLIGYAMPIGMASFVVMGAWSAFGISGYLRRTLLATSIGGIIIGSLCLGYAWSYWYSSSQMIFFGDTLSFATLLILLVSFGLSVAAQIPFLIARSFFGWRFSFDPLKAGDPTSIKELFAIVFVFALAIACSQFAVRFYTNETLNQIRVGEDYMFLDEDDAGTNPTYYQTELTNANLELAKKQALVEGREYAIVLLTYASITVAISLISLPIIWTVFRCRTKRNSFLLLLGYILAFFCLVGAVCSAIMGFGVFIGQVSVDVVQQLAILFTAIWLPFAVMSGSGLQLLTKRSAPSHPKTSPEFGDS